MQESILDAARAQITSLFEKEIKKAFLFHTLERTQQIEQYARKIIDKTALPEGPGEEVLLAILFHDTGRASKGGKDPIAESQKVAADFLEQHSFSETRKKHVLELIRATDSEHSSQNIQEKIIKDALLAYLTNELYLNHLDNLRWEERTFHSLHYDDGEWLNLQRQKLRSEDFLTEAGQKLFGKQKKKNEKSLKKLAKQAENKLDIGLRQGIADSRTAQMMFKTALRNHIDLTNIADNKANIMLSTNAIIITIMMPLLATNIKGNAFLLIPASVLLLTCVLSIIFATLATRPIKMSGYTDLSKQKADNTNLFFFGNFFNMSISEFHQGIRTVVADEQILEDSILNDLYYLGAALGHKYLQLRTCYSIFMIGITSTVVAFAISFFISQMP